MKTLLYSLSLVAMVLALVPTSVFSAEQKTFTIGLIGDSTVASTSGWGPAFADRFNEHATVLNYARGGATLKSLTNKLDELLEQKPDFVLIQFGHNDQKRYGPKEYQQELTSYVERVTAAGAKAIVLSSVTRRNFDSSGKIVLREGGQLKAKLSEYAKMAREVARQQQVPFINLHAISIEHHNRLGPEATAAYNFKENDTTHFSPAGAAATAELILTELKTAVPELAPFLKK